MHNLFLFIVTMGMFTLPLVSISIFERASASKNAKHLNRD
jgi:hypothetical protein